MCQVLYDLFWKGGSFAKEKSRLTIVKKLIFGYQYHNSFICNYALNFDVVSRGDDDREQSNPTFARIGLEHFA